MKLNSAKMSQRVLALICTLALVISVLPVYKAKAAGVFTVNTHEAVPIGTIAYPDDTISVVCREEDYQSYQLLTFVDENGNMLDYRYGYYGQGNETVPYIKGIDYWEVTSSNVQTNNDVFSTNGGPVIYVIQTTLTARYGKADANNNNGTSGYDNTTTGNDYETALIDINNNLPSNDQFFDYWDDVIANNAVIDFGQYQVTDQLETTNNGSVDEERRSGQPAQQVIYQVAEADSDITATPTPTPEDKPRGPVNPDVDYQPSPSPEPTATPEPTDDPRGHANPDVTDIPSPTPDDDQRGPANPEVSPIPSPEPSDIPAPSATPTLAPTATPKPTATPTPKPTATPVPQQVTTPMPTPYVPQTYVPPVPTGPVQVIAQVKEPEHVVYNIDLEVGRYAKITPKYARNDTHKSSNTKIILDPRSDVGSFSSQDFEARAVAPGNATLTFKTNSENYTEDWNVNVYCRPLDFEKTQYVVYSPKDKDAWITLYLKYFEYEYEYAYDFVWSSSEDSKSQSKRQIYLAGGTKTTTYARYCIRKGTEGAFKVTVKDKYGNSASTVIIVRPEVVETPSTEKTEKENKDSGNKDKNTETTTLTLKQIKKALKSVSIDMDCTNNKYKKMTFTWSGDTITGAPFSGYEIMYAKYKKGTSADKLEYKTLKDIKKGTTQKYTYTGKKLKKNKTYVMYVRAYITVDGKKYYNTTPSEDYMKIKIKK